MKKSRFTETRIVSILKQHEGGLKVTEICRQHGISPATFHNWKAKYGGLDAKLLSQLKELKAENAWLKRMYAETSMINDALKMLLKKKALGPGQKREVAQGLIRDHHLSERQACIQVGLPRSTFQYKRKTKDDDLVITQLRMLVEKHPAIGF